MANMGQAIRDTPELVPARAHSITVRFPLTAIFEFTTATATTLPFRSIFPGATTDPDGTILRVTLPSQAAVHVEGFGIPFIDTGDPEIVDWINTTATISNDYTLMDIISQRNFAFYLDISVQQAKRRLGNESVARFYQPPTTSATCTKLKDFPAVVKHGTVAFLPTYR